MQNVFSSKRFSFHFKPHWLYAPACISPPKTVTKMYKSRVYSRQFTEKNTVYMYVRYRFHYIYGGENMV